MGSFRLAAGRRHLYRHCNFTGIFVETVPKSLHLSCGSELTRQGISLIASLCDVPYLLPSTVDGARRMVSEGFPSKWNLPC